MPPLGCQAIDRDAGEVDGVQEHVELGGHEWLKVVQVNSSHPVAEMVVHRKMLAGSGAMVYAVGKDEAIQIARAAPVAAFGGGLAQLNGGDDLGNGCVGDTTWGGTGVGTAAKEPDKRSPEPGAQPGKLQGDEQGEDENSRTVEEGATGVIGVG